MLDIQKELKQYWPGDWEEPKESLDAIHNVLETFNQVLRKIGKDQYTLTGTMDEVMELLEDRNQEEEEVRRYRLDMKNKEEEVDDLVHVLVSALDQFEQIYRYSIKNEGEEWKRQIKSQWEKIGDQLRQHGINRIEGEDTSPVPRLHKVINTIPQEGHKVPIIIEVLQSGYEYKGNVVRKAEVIISG